MYFALLYHYQFHRVVLLFRCTTCSQIYQPAYYHVLFHSSTRRFCPLANIRSLRSIFFIIIKRVTWCTVVQSTSWSKRYKFASVCSLTFGIIHECTSQPTPSKSFDTSFGERAREREKVSGPSSRVHCMLQKIDTICFRAPILRQIPLIRNGFVSTTHNEWRHDNDHDEDDAKIPKAMQFLR